MKYITIALALIASSRQVLAQPAPMRTITDVDSSQLDITPADLAAHGAYDIDYDDFAPPSSSKASVAAKLKIRQNSRAKIIARKLAKEEKKRSLQAQVPLLPEEEEVDAEVCNGRVFAHFPSVSWRTPTSGKVSQL